ncbi:SAM-dependent methyltransferase [Actinopolyspora saharensis]|uniref:S-adenosyl methyltransferase n=1 Tax=Actinopolyspora saharensis TaxID=995062 RepID=A0A1H0YTZ1_9ACTN|nr:SAM-dependent methyltransferase [Actinopolyspora saharensis]SDQ18590.1 S-adenosyl methyltransferase [Actinopolyspora saharensis]
MEGNHGSDAARCADQPPTGEVDHSTPNIARMYDYLLGGAANFEVDRDAAEEFNASVPGNVEWAYSHARSNRAFLGRAVRYCVSRGIDQFLDLGSGVPTKGNVHEIAQQHDPHARVAYVDVEPIAVHHARQLLDGHSRVTVTRADARKPDQVLAASGVAELLDFTRPVAVLAVALLEVLGEVDPVELIAAYREACAPGSVLVLSHMTQLSLTDEQVDAFRAMMASTPTPNVRFVSREQLDLVGAGYQWAEPGVVPLDHWRPERAVSDEQARRANSYAAVGVLEDARR